MPGNVLIAQSGGPSAVINNTLRGMIEGCQAYPSTFGRLYAGWHGIKGVLKEELLDLSAQDEREVALLRTTPAAGAIGTCRYKLRPEQQDDFERVVEVLRAHDIHYFFYIGGNDSMDTAAKISRLARERCLDLVVVGGPKTIDNDVGDAEFRLVDHTPGYGSAARYLAQTILNANEENAGSCPADPVLVIQAMGRRIGFIAAAARLADPQREMPLQIYLAESGMSLAEIGENVGACLAKSGRCIVVVSEGLDVGDLGEVRDPFGHTSFGSSQRSVAQIVANHINSLRLPVRGNARYQIPGTDQRSAAIYASTVDMDEACEVGRKCVLIAKDEGDGWMGTILRKPGDAYTAVYDKVPLMQVARSERTFPRAWISESRSDVTDDFVRYARPLIGQEWPEVPLVGGLQRFAKFAPVFAVKKCKEYVPQAF
ncbi:MAG: diphosphate--fructose-6-phosphate 1-phosphotransferase [Planctomycetes bacterium]|nr:diphosphate--fructose-6-phosphate 1-phosphotransferase [Planctomycetota bacterium]